MTDYTARRILLKNADGEHLIPYTDKLERDLSDMSVEGAQAILNKIHADGAVLQYWSASLTPTAYQTVVTYKTGTTAYFYVNKTGVNTDAPPNQDSTNWEMISFTNAGAANADLSNLSATGNDKFVTKNTAQTISGVKTFSSGTLRTLEPLLLKQNNTTEGGQINFERSGGSVLSSNPYIDLNTNTIRVIGVSSQNATHITLKVDLENNQVLVPTPAATDGSYQAATTAWCQSYIGVVDYSAGTDVTASVFATSGTGYKPAYKGVLMIKTYNSTAIAYLSVYNASGTLLFEKEINSAPYPNTSGGLVVLPVSQSYSYRVGHLAAGDSYALFCPYRSH